MKGTMKTLPFASSYGGPVVVLPAEVAPHWLGLSDDTFYKLFLDRCSKVRRTEYGGFATMELAGSLALIFDGEIHTSWLQEPEGGTFIREGCTHTPAAARALVASVSADAWKRFATLDLTDGRLIALDSALAAGDLGAADASNGIIEARLAPGRYLVELAALGGTDFARLRSAGPEKAAAPKRAPVRRR